MVTTPTSSSLALKSNDKTEDRHDMANWNETEAAVRALTRLITLTKCFCQKGKYDHYQTGKLLISLLLFTRSSVMTVGFYSSVSNVR